MFRAEFITGTLALAAGARRQPFAALARPSTVRLGVAARDLGTKREIGEHRDQHFPLASTFKVPLVMTVLDRVDRKRDRLDRRIAFTRADLEPPYSEIARRYPHGGRLTLDEICALTIEQSDNTGADLLLRQVGGPAAVTAYLRRIGIDGIRVDFRERDMPGRANLNDPRHTGTPRAMCDLMTRLAVRSPLSPGSTLHLLSWMRSTATGDKRLRAGVPAGWNVADKTGTLQNAVNDVGLLFPRAGSPIAIAVFVASPSPLEDGEQVIAGCARIAARFFRP